MSRYYHIRVDHVDRDTQPAQFRTLFQPLGSIKSRIWRADDGWAVVTFKSEEAAKNAIVAINGRPFRGRTLATKWASASDVQFAEAPKGPSGSGADSKPGPAFNDSDRRGNTKSYAPSSASSRPASSSSHTRDAPPVAAASSASYGAPSSAKGVASGKPLWNFNLGPKSIEPGADIANHQFIIMDCEGALDDGISIIPSEIAVSKFSLKDGEVSHFHYFIDPGHLPMCHLDESIWRATNTTGVSFESRNHLAEKNYSKIWTELCDYLGFPVPDKWTQDMVYKLNVPVIYAKQPALKTRCLEWLAEKSGFPQFFGEVKPIEELIWTLRMHKGNPIQTSHVQDFFQKLATQYFQFCNPSSTNVDRNFMSQAHKLFIESRCDHHRKLFTQDSSTAKVTCALSGPRVLLAVLRQIMSEAAAGNS